MIDGDQSLMVAGLTIGLASSLHCLGMCGGIAATLGLAAARADGDSRRSLFAINLMANSGRILGYMIAGALVGGAGSEVFGALDRSVAHVVLRWAAAVSLIWIGLATLEWVPLPALLIRLAHVVSSRIAAFTHLRGRPTALGWFGMGCAWGLFPCAMVYAALFYAMLSGSWTGGTIVMLGFGLGTLVPVMGAGLGLPLLRQRATTRRLRSAVGFAIIAVAIVSVAVPAATVAGWCKFG